MGVKPYPGTLNVHINYPIIFRNPIAIYEDQWFMFPCTLIKKDNKHPTYLIRNKKDIDNIDHRLIEIISDVNLRDAMQLKDKSRVSIIIDKKYIR